MYFEEEILTKHYISYIILAMTMRRTKSYQLKTNLVEDGNPSLSKWDLFFQRAAARGMKTGLSINDQTGKSRAQVLTEELWKRQGRRGDERI